MKPLEHLEVITDYLTQKRVEGAILELRIGIWDLAEPTWYAVIETTDGIPDIGESSYDSPLPVDALKWTADEILALRSQPVTA